MTDSHSIWLAKAQRITYPTQALIAGALTASASGETLDVISPRDGRLLTRIAACGEIDVDRSVARAHSCFEQGVWANQPAKQRKQVLLRLADLMEADADNLALLETLDMGMTISDSTTMNVPGAIECMRWYAELIDKQYDEIAPTGPNALTRIHRVPVGVVAAIVPWNYPLMIACWKLAPALAAGNSVILKPAEQSSLTALRLAELALHAGLPEGVLSVLPGHGHVIGEALGMHRAVDAVAFTGSSRVGGLYMQYAGQSNLKRVSIEGSGKTPHIVLADAPDLDAVAASVVLGAFSNQGQICNAGSRLIVDRAVKAELLAKVIERIGHLRCGDPLDPGTEAGPLVDKHHLERVMTYIALGQDQGANKRLGGARDTSIDPDGCYLQPTLFDDVAPTMHIAREEIFGPVLSVIEVDGVDEAIQVANDTVYGLGTAVWTRDLYKMEKVAARVRAGVIWVNCHDHGDISSPVGGFKQSGFGRDKSIHALDKYTEFKTVWVNLATS